MCGGHHVVLLPDADQNRRQATEHRVGHVVGKRKAREAHGRRKGAHAGDRQQRDRAAEETGQRIGPHQRLRRAGQAEIEHVRGDGQAAPADQHHGLGADAVGGPTADRAANRQGQRRGDVRLQRQGRGNVKHLLHEDRRHQDHHHHGGRQHPGHQRHQQHGGTVLAQHGLHRQLAGHALACGEFLEDRCLFQKAAQIHRHEAEHAAQNERNAPCKLVDFRRAVMRVDGHGHQRSQQDAAGDARGERAHG